MRSEVYYALLVFVGGCSYGVTSTIVKTAYRYGYTVNEVVGGQVVLGVLVLWMLTFLFCWKRLPLLTIGKLLIAGVPIGLTTIFYYSSLERVAASLGLVLLFQFVWIGVLLERIVQGKTISRQKAAAILFLLTGSALASGLTPDMLVSNWLGYALGLASAVTYATVLLVSGTVATDVPSVLKTAWMSIGACIVILLFLPPTFLLDPTTAWNFLPFMVFLACFGLVLPPFLFSIGVPKIGAGLSSILTSSELPVGIMLSYLILEEQFLRIQWIGVLCILTGIVIGNLRRD
ncbi:DMT family transporter [Selenomonas sp. TAMA-11512]|uniref:DMT family transporter n=1 Tax=Selenomonas sp. TAMA-11512 TaxID=3095337 RepID=UPI00308E30AB|nr:DMT family transporter [Selenomonas sp. TAMA-11512]